MRILALLLFSASLQAYALTQKDFSMVVAMETRANREVNPDYVNPKYSGMLFAKLRLRPWNILLEMSRSERDSRSGALHVNSESTRLAAWSRYEFLPDSSWTPFAAAGGGFYSDRVSTSFGQTTVNSSGKRGMLGLGAGISAVFWNHLTLEAEGRLESVEYARDPVLAGIVRLGCRM